MSELEQKYRVAMDEIADYKFENQRLFSENSKLKEEIKNLKQEIYNIKNGFPNGIRRIESVEDFIKNG